jgi:hypothetical protein
VAIALHMWGCATEIAPQIDTERRFDGLVQPPPPSPPVRFDMSLFLRKLASGQYAVSGGFAAGQTSGSVNGTLKGNLDDGAFAGRLLAPEARSGLAGPAVRNTHGVLALFLPSMLLASMQGTTCVVEQVYEGTVTVTGVNWTPREVVRSCQTNPLDFAIQAAPVLTQQVTTSVATTSSVPTTSVATTISTTTTSIPTTSTTTSVTTTSTTTVPASTTTTTTIPPI